MFCRISGETSSSGEMRYNPFRLTPYLLTLRDSDAAYPQPCCLLIAERVHSGYEGTCSLCVYKTHSVSLFFILSFLTWLFSVPQPLEFLRIRGYSLLVTLRAVFFKRWMSEQFLCQDTCLKTWWELRSCSASIQMTDLSWWPSIKRVSQVPSSYLDLLSEFFLK